MGAQSMLPNYFNFLRTNNIVHILWFNAGQRTEISGKDFTTCNMHQSQNSVTLSVLAIHSA